MQSTHLPASSCNGFAEQTRTTRGESNKDSAKEVSTGSKRKHRSLKTFVALAGAAAGIVGMSPSQAPAQAEPEWLTTVNAYRAASGVGPIVNDPVQQSAVDKHVQYLAATASLVHNEDPAHPLYSPEGALAAQQSLLGGWQGADRSDRQIVEDWMAAPFHAVHILEPRWQRGAYTSTHRPGGELTVAGVLNVTGGIGKKVAVKEPILFPGRGSTVPMTSFNSEVPNPLTACPGYVSPAGLPILAMFPNAPSAAGVTLSQGGNPLEICIIDRNYANPDGAAQATGRQLINQKNLVMIIPRAELAAGSSYDVTVDGGTAGKVAWSFTVGGADAALPKPLANRVTQSAGAPAPAAPKVAVAAKPVTAKAPVVTKPATKKK
jgi:uncharacterized protein YkwD